ncbi:hypothetical protein [Vibrio algarum]|uniref:Uncharacterized protein n=1 Tax=Vibrio algarum TaxID=3020714 RepID=A0ABT4YWP6_9VIBR|nr:hypothetical protein [Vibrio sp. KJ40-1]MDB1125996.1 hypothetical protein [Vibrio sp. KJ40-1]
MLLFMFASSTIYACGLHQATGFNFVTEPGSLDVFANIIEVRQSNALGNIKKPQHFQLFAFKGAVSKPYPAKVNFSIFEPIKGHYSEVETRKTVTVSGRESLLTINDILVITELDVLDALATNTLSWQQAKAQGLVKVNGTDSNTEALDRWFTQLF